MCRSHRGFGPGSCDSVLAVAGRCCLFRGSMDARTNHLTPLATIARATDSESAGLRVAERGIEHPAATGSPADQGSEVRNEVRLLDGRVGPFGELNLTILPE